MRAGLLAASQLLEALAHREVRVVGRGIDLEEPLERRAGGLVLAGVEVGPTKGLQDRCLAWLQPVGPFEDDGRLGMVASLEQRLTTLEQLVCGLLVHPRSLSPRGTARGPRP